MSLLEAQVAEVRALLAAAPHTAVAFDAAAAAPKGAHAGLILKADMVSELGAPETASADIALYSNEAAGDEAWLVGAPLSALAGRSTAFAEVVILKGAKVDAETYYQFSVRRQRLADFPGWMVKAAAGKIWVRTAAAGGAAPSLEAAAATLITRTHEAFPQVTGVEVWYVTELEDIVQALAQRAQALQSDSRRIKEGVWKARGFDYQSCQLAGHCGGCADKKTCASVRTMEARVRVNRRRQNTNSSGDTPK